MLCSVMKDTKWQWTLIVMLLVITARVGVSVCATEVRQLTSQPLQTLPIKGDIVGPRWFSVPLATDVVEPGRLLNIFLGSVVVMSFMVLNSILLIAIGLAGTLPTEKNEEKQSRRSIQHHIFQTSNISGQLQLARFVLDSVFNLSHHSYRSSIFN